MSAILTGLLLFFLLASFSLTAINSVFRRFRRHSPKSEIRKVTRYFFYTSIHRRIVSSKQSETLFFATIWAKNIFRFLYAATAILIVIDWDYIAIIHSNSSNISTLHIGSWLLVVLFVLLFLFLTLLIGDFLPRLCANRAPRSTIRMLAPFTSTLLTLCLPVSYILLKLSPIIVKKIHTLGNTDLNKSLKEKIIEIIEEVEVTNEKNLDIHDKKLIHGIVNFKERIVREIIIPRIDTFMLSATTSARDATEQMAQKGFSRAPVYEDSMDNVIGVFLVKDVLSMAMKGSENIESYLIDQEIKHLVKPVIYSPETQKVSQLLQEFRKKQGHLAVVVDEYGGTAGIVTIEDILEEIVGEISDEYDQEVELYTKEPDGTLIIDARMSILSIEEELNIRIPQESDYDTIGGYVFFKAGEIPSKGLLIHHDDFELEIISSDERSIDKVKVYPTTQI